MTKSKPVIHMFLRLGLDKAGWYVDCMGGGRFRPRYGENLAELRKAFQEHLLATDCPPKEGDCK